MKIKESYKNIIILLVFVGSFLLITKTFAVNNHPFRPGETRDPSCAPGDLFCTVTLEKDLYKENSLGVITNITSGVNSIVIGSGASSSGDYSIAIGHEDADMMNPGPVASGDYSIAIGNISESSGRYSFSALSGSASGDYSTSIGEQSMSLGKYSTSIGAGTYAPSYRESSFGSYPTLYSPTSDSAWSTSDRIFNVGVGQNSSIRSDAFTILKNGNIGIKNSSPDLSLVIDATDAIRLPSGETAQRPENVIAGEIRFNTDTQQVEYRNRDNWVSLGGETGAVLNLIKENVSTLVPEDLPVATGKKSLAIGVGTHSKGTLEISLGRFPKISQFTGSLEPNATVNDLGPNDIIFTLGNGESTSSRRNAMIVNASGVIGFGNVSQESLSTALGNSIFITTSVGAELDNNGQWQTPSDETLKENIKDLGYGLDTVLRLKPRSFDFIKTGKPSIGFIAQELEEVVPEVVSSNSLGKKTVSYSELVAVLTNAVIELTGRVENLERQGGLITPVIERVEEDITDSSEELNMQETEETISEEGISQQASIIKTSNSLNLTNVLLIILIGLLLINISLFIKNKTDK